VSRTVLERGVGTSLGGIPVRASPGGWKQPSGSRILTDPTSVKPFDWAAPHGGGPFRMRVRVFPSGAGER